MGGWDKYRQHFQGVLSQRILYQVNELDGCKSKGSTFYFTSILQVSLLLSWMPVEDPNSTGSEMKDSLLFNTTAVAIASSFLCLSSEP